jgi:hypothetical protein
MDKFLDTSDQPKLNQEDISHLNRSISRNNNEAAIESSKNKTHDLMDSQMNSTRTLKNN